MTSQKIEELTKDLAELDAISGQLTRPRNIDTISLQIKRIETELTHLREQLNVESATSGKSATAPKPTSTDTRRYECEITNYAWDQSDKFVKLFIGLDGVQNASEENVVVTFTSNSILLKVADVQGKDYKFAINNLLHEIDVSASYRKIKTNSIAIYAKKATEKKKWSHLTVTEKRVADVKKTSLTDDDAEDNKDDPSSGLMKIMQKMYETGDPEMKRMIAKAWTEGQEKNMKNPGMPQF